MLRRLLLATALFVLCAPDVPAQFERRTPPAQADAAYSSAISQWANQFTLDAQQLRDALAARGDARFRGAVQQATQLHGAAVAFGRAVRNRPARDLVEREYRQLDEVWQRTAAVVRPLARAEGDTGLSRAVSRLEYDEQQLGAAVTQGFAGQEGGRFDERSRQQLAQLARSLDTQADDLLRVAAHTFRDDPAGRRLERDAAAFTTATGRLRESLEANDPWEKVARAYEAVTRRWNGIAQEMSASRFVAESTALREQAGQVDRLLRSMGQLQGLAEEIVFPPTENPGFPVMPRDRVAFAVGAGEGGGPHVRLYHSARAEDHTDFFAYDADFRGGVRVALGDVTGDGVSDVVTAPGPGMPPLVRVFDGRDLSLRHEFYALDGRFDRGLWVAVGDLAGGKRNEIVVAPDAGGPPVVQVFSARGERRTEFFAFDREYGGGVRIAVGDVTGDGAADVVAAPGRDAVPRVRVFDGRTQRMVREWDAYTPDFTGGVFVAAADFTGRGRAEVVTGAGEGGGPHVAVFDGRTGQKVTEMSAFDPEARSGVRVAIRDTNGDGVPDIIAAPGAGMAPVVRVFDGRTWKVMSEFLAFEPNFTGGVFVSSR